jgi:hypothetical protein
VVVVLEVKGQGKLHPRRGNEGPKGEYRYSSTLSSTSALDGVGGQRHAPAALPPGKRPGTHCPEAEWVPGPVWTGAENLAPKRIRSPNVQPCGIAVVGSKVVKRNSPTVREFLSNDEYLLDEQLLTVHYPVSLPSASYTYHNIP